MLRVRDWHTYDREQIPGCRASFAHGGPHELPDVVGRELSRLYGADSVDLLMADYGLTVLQPVTELPHTLPAVSVHNTPAGRAFGAQEPFVGGTSGTAACASICRSPYAGTVSACSL